VRSRRVAAIVGLCAGASAWALSPPPAEGPPPPPGARPALSLAPGAVAPPLSLPIDAPFPEGVEFKISCGYSPCTPYHAHLDDPDEVNDFYALDLIRNQRGNGRGLAVTAAAPGEVVAAGWGQGRWSIYGRIVAIEHDGGDGHLYTSVYAHLSEVSVAVGQRVERKAAIGAMGGSCFGVDDKLAPHLHFALYQGARIESGGPIGGRAVRPEPMEGYTRPVQDLVLTAGIGAREAVYRVVDDQGPGFSITGAVEVTETVAEPFDQWAFGWTEVWTGPEGYGAATRVSSAPARSAGPASAQGQWTPPLEAPGRYRIEAFGPISSAATATAARYRVRTAGGEVECPLDQSAGEGTWRALCGGRVFDLAPGDAVLLDDVTGDTDGRRVAWDALRFVGAPQ
jgi:hypothetical protein